MNNKLEELLTKIKLLEQELLVEMQKKEKKYLYEIRNRKVLFQQEMKTRNKQFIKRIHHYLFDAAFLNILTAPMIWACLPPALLLDLMVSLYQRICFPVYGIPKVQRKNYIIFDRQYLSYLNLIEKINCCYCGYFNGLIGYILEIGARTEQYWCPIKHAHRTGTLHSRYDKFFDYGDGEGFRARLETVRSGFDDVEE